MARATTVGTLGIGDIKYGNYFSDDEFPRNQKLANGLAYSYSNDFRWSTRKYIKYLIHTTDTDSPIQTHSQWYQMTDSYIVDASPRDVQVNIPVTTTTQYVNNFSTIFVKNDTSAPLSPASQPYNFGYGSAVMGMNTTEKGNSLSLTRPITDWNFNKVAVYPKIYALYGYIYDDTQDNFITFDYNRPWVANGVDLDDFFDNHTRPAHNDEFIGYIVAYEIVFKGDVSNDDYSYFSMLEENYIENSTVLLNDSQYPDVAPTKSLELKDLYGIAPLDNILLGPAPYYNMADYYTMMQKWIGPTEIEGANLITTKKALYNWNIRTTSDIIIAPFSALDKDTFESWFVKSDLVSIAAQLGLPVITNGADKNRFVYQDADISTLGSAFVPKIKDGIIDPSTLIQGQDIADTEQYKNAQDGKGVMETTPEVDITDPDTNNYVDEIDLEQPPFTPIGKFSHYYALSTTDLEDLLDFLYTDDPTYIADILDKLKLNGENPMNFMIGLRMMPFNILDYITSSPAEIGFGNGVATGVMAEEIGSDSFIIDLGECSFRRYFNNFLDYEPYTTAKLYIPYCNELEIPTSLFVGHKIKVELVVDITTGSCVGVVKRDGAIMYYTNGNIGVEIPITGENSMEYVRTAIDTAVGTVNWAVGMASNAAMLGTTSISSGKSATSQFSYSGGKTTNLTQHDSNTMSAGSSTQKKVSPSGIVGGITEGFELAYNFNNQPSPLQTNGQGTPFLNFYKPRSCYFIVSSPIPMVPDGYAENFGYACMKKARLDNLDGLIVARNPRVQPEHATSAETKEINDLLSTGVWK